MRWYRRCAVVAAMLLALSARVSAQQVLPEVVVGPAATAPVFGPQPQPVYAAPVNTVPVYVVSPDGTVMYAQPATSQFAPQPMVLVAPRRELRPPRRRIQPAYTIGVVVGAVGAAGAVASLVLLAIGALENFSQNVSRCPLFYGTCGPYTHPGDDIELVGAVIGSVAVVAGMVGLAVAVASDRRRAVYGARPLPAVAFAPVPGGGGVVGMTLRF